MKRYVSIFSEASLINANKLKNIKVNIQLDNKVFRTNTSLFDAIIALNQGDLNSLLTEEAMSYNYRNGFMVIADLQTLGSFFKKNKIFVNLDVDMEDYQQDKTIMAKLDIFTKNYEDYGYGGSYHNDQNPYEVIDFETVESDLNGMVEDLRSFIRENSEY